jgi:hypothetical protein
MPGTQPNIPLHNPAISSTPSSTAKSASAVRPLFDSQLLALASLGCVAFLLLIVALLVAMLFCARKSGKKKSAKYRNDAEGPHCGAGIFLDREEKLYFPGAAVAATAEDGQLKFYFPSIIK